MVKKLLLIFAVLTLLCSCKKENVIIQFDPMSNFPQTDVVEMDFDMTNGVSQGLELPAEDSVFEFTFTINNKDAKKYYYKIFYQNVSYAFDDNHPLSFENFYGSWQDTDIKFKPVKTQTVKDSFKIVGNPRNEKKYFGWEFPYQYNEADISEGFAKIKEDKQWYNSIVQKAKDNGVSVTEQMYKDLMYQMEANRNSQGDFNRRERRNPRTGNYEFMLVIAEEKALKQIPEYIQNIALTADSVFVNPFDWFLNKKGKNIKGVYTFVSSKQLKVRARYDTGKGVYINRAAYPYYDFRVYPDNPSVGNDDTLYKYAQFEEYYHNINTERNIKQIKKIADISGGDYTLEDYLKTLNNKNIITENIHPVITSLPGKNIRVTDNAIVLINPGNKSYANAVKENTGIKARIGFTYGKYIYKIKFPALLNKSGLWTGLTNAAWLIYQNPSSWNNRRTSAKGYVKENYNENETERIHDTHYSEIDIEMIKTSPFWPSQKSKQPAADAVRKNGKFVFAATNWDLADGDINYLKGHMLFNKTYNGKQFTYNRWNEHSRNLTSRTEISNDIFDLPYYYYVIEWKPREIIWYIGEDLDHLQVVGYMSDAFTSVPNNQMVPVITQEYHYSEYWPPVIFEQGLLPYPLNDIKGILYELTVE